jgi:hypothetical protein
MVPYTEITLMLLNLSKAFSFQNDADVFSVDYIFFKNASETGQPIPQIWLVFNVSMNDSEKKEYRLGMNQSTLYQNNDSIEAMIKKETLMMQPA